MRKFSSSVILNCSLLSFDHRHLFRRCRVAHYLITLDVTPSPLGEYLQPSPHFFSSLRDFGSMYSTRVCRIFLTLSTTPSQYRRVRLVPSKLFRREREECEKTRWNRLV